MTDTATIIEGGFVSRVIEGPSVRPTDDAGAARRDLYRRGFRRVGEPVRENGRTIEIWERRPKNENHS